MELVFSFLFKIKVAKMELDNGNSFSSFSKYQATVMLFMTLLLGYLAIQFLRRTKNTPPGPFAWPLIGNLLDLKPEPHLSLTKMAKTYGNVFKIWFSTDLCIVLNDYESMKKAFSNDVYSGRMKGTISDLFIGNNGLIMSDGDLWREHRRFAISTLRDLGMGKSWLQERVLEEVQFIIDIVKQQKGQPYDPEDVITTGVANIICAAIFGKRFEHDDQDFLHIVHFLKESLKKFGQSNLMVLFPKLRYLPWFRSEFKRMKYDDDTFFTFMVRLIEDTQRASLVHEDGTRDYISAFTKEGKRQTEAGKPDNTFHMEQLKVSVGNMFVAGIETSSSTLLIGCLHIIENPDVMAKIQLELDSVVGRDEMIRMEHRGRLPYTEATIFELLRLASVAPLGVFHRTMEASTLNGYSIPANSIVISNIYAMHRDPLIFPDPEKFDPTRYLDAVGNFVKSPYVVAFSLGKRACLGENLAQMELFLIFTNLLHSFNLTVPEGAVVSSKNVKVGVTVTADPYKLIFQPRF